jgi:hypothetical protein
MLTLSREVPTIRLVATDLDRYGTKLGRRFQVVRALLCSPDDAYLGVDRAARYIQRTLLHDEAELATLHREAQRIVRGRQGWLLGDHDIALERFERSASRSLGACHLVEAALDAVNGTCDPRDILPNFVRRAVSGVIALAHTQRDYVKDVELHKVLAANRSNIEGALLGRLRAPFEGTVIGAPSLDLFACDQVALLNLVVARSVDARER